MTTNLMDDTGDQPDIDLNKNYLEELVGEGKKFQTPEELAKGKYLADLHVKTLETRLDEMREDFIKAREEAQTGRKVAELLDRLDEAKNLQSRENTQSNEDTQKADTFDSKQIESLISSRIQDFERTKNEEANFNLIRNKLQERLGNNYKNVLKEQADQLGLTDDDVNLMARKNPNLFIKTFDLNAKQDNDNFQTPPRSEVRSNFTPKNQKRTLSYYQALRAKDPMIYYDPKIANQMDKDAQALGKDFFDV